MPDPIPFRPNARTAARLRSKREQEKQRIIDKVGFNHEDAELYDEYIRFLAVMQARGQEV